MKQPENVTLKTGYNRGSTPGDLMLRLSSGKLHESAGLRIVISSPLVSSVILKRSNFKKHFSSSVKIVFVIPFFINGIQTCNVCVSRVFHQWHGDSKHYVTNDLNYDNSTLHISTSLQLRSAFFNSRNLIDQLNAPNSQLKQKFSGAMSIKKNDFTAAYKYDKTAECNALDSKNYKAVQTVINNVNEQIYSNFIYSGNTELQTGTDYNKRLQLLISKSNFHIGTVDSKYSYINSDLFSHFFHNRILNRTLVSDSEKKLKIHLSLPAMAVQEKGGSSFRVKGNSARSDVLIYSDGVFIQQNSDAMTLHGNVIVAGERERSKKAALHMIQDPIQIKSKRLSGSVSNNSRELTSLHNMHYSHTNTITQNRFFSLFHLISRRSEGQNLADTPDLSGMFPIKNTFPNRRLSHVRMDTSQVSMLDVKATTERMNRRSLIPVMNDLQHVSKSVEQVRNDSMSEVNSHVEERGMGKEMHKNGISLKKPLSISDTPVEFITRNHIGEIADKVVHIIEERFHTEAKRKGLL